MGQTKNVRDNSLDSVLQCDCIDLDMMSFIVVVKTAPLIYCGMCTQNKVDLEIGNRVTVK